MGRRRSNRPPNYVAHINDARLVCNSTTYSSNSPPVHNNIVASVYNFNNVPLVYNPPNYAVRSTGSTIIGYGPFNSPTVYLSAIHPVFNPFAYPNNVPPVHSPTVYPSAVTPVFNPFIYPNNVPSLHNPTAYPNLATSVNEDTITREYSMYASHRNIPPILGVTDLAQKIYDEHPDKRRVPTTTGVAWTNTSNQTYAVSKPKLSSSDAVSKPKLSSSDAKNEIKERLKSIPSKYYQNIPSDTEDWSPGCCVEFRTVWQQVQNSQGSGYRHIYAYAVNTKNRIRKRFCGVCRAWVKNVVDDHDGLVIVDVADSCKPYASDITKLTLEYSAFLNELKRLKCSSYLV